MRTHWSRRSGIGVLVGVAGLALGACGATGATGASGSSRAPASHSGTRHSGPGHPAILSSANATTCTGPTVTATGSGTVNVAPDLLSITLDVHTQASTATVALRDDNARARALVATLKSAGVTNSDIQTTGLSIEPTYSRPKGQPARISGYQVDNTVTAEVHKLSSAGTLIDRAVAQVGKAVRLEGISFSLQNPNAAEATAHTQAVKAAISQAQSMATAAGTTLGTLCSVTDTGGADYGASASASSASGGAGGAVPIEAGSQQVSASVRIVYNLAG